MNNEAGVKPPLIISSSSLSTFKQCKKLYEIQYEWNRDIGSSSAMAAGSTLHKMLEGFLIGWRDGQIPFDVQRYGELADPEMLPVFEQYLQRRLVKQLHTEIAEVLHVEEPMYAEVRPGVIMRITPDLVYRDKDGWIVGRDFKSFEKASTWDVDLDYQGKLYDAFLAVVYPKDNVRFEWEKIRRFPPGVPHNKKMECWSEAECYESIERYQSNKDRAKVWTELLWDVDELLRTRENQHYSRTSPGIKSGWGSCSTCRAKELCKADFDGSLTEQDLDFYSTPRKPLTLENANMIAAPHE